MEHILIFADSLSWGLIPNTRKRLPFQKRWPGICENILLTKNHNIRIIENCLNGRRSVWDDPFKEGRNASKYLSQAIEINSPLDLVVLMLGTNDFQSTHDNNAWLSAQGIVKLINIIKNAPIEPNMPSPDILVIAPPKITTAKGQIKNKFIDANKRCINFSNELEIISKENVVHFLNADNIVKVSNDDGVHLDEPQHQILAEAVSDMIVTILSENK